MKNREGFTLIELLLYAALIGMVVSAASVFLTVLQKQRIRSQVIMEVEGQGQSMIRTITQVIRNASSVTLPALGTTGSSATLVVPTGSLSPTVFSISSGNLNMQEGANPALALNNSRVTVSGVSFANLGRLGTEGSLRIQFTVSYGGSGLPSEYTFSKTFVSSASLR